MKKKLMASLLALCMVVSMLPLTAFADTTPAGPNIVSVKESPLSAKLADGSSVTPTTTAYSATLSTSDLPSGVNGVVTLNATGLKATYHDAITGTDEDGHEWKADDESTNYTVGVGFELPQGSPNYYIATNNAADFSGVNFRPWPDNFKSVDGSKTYLNVYFNLGTLPKTLTKYVGIKATVDGAISVYQVNITATGTDTAGTAYNETDVKAANLTAVEGQEAPAFGHTATGGYTVGYNKDSRVITITANELQVTENSAGNNAYWVGLALKQTAGNTYAYGFGSRAEAGESTGLTYRSAGSTQSDGTNTYDTLYWGWGSAAGAKNATEGWLSVKGSDNKIVDYQVIFAITPKNDVIRANPTGPSNPWTSADVTEITRNPENANDVTVKLKVVNLAKHESSDSASLPEAMQGEHYWIGIGIPRAYTDNGAPGTPADVPNATKYYQGWNSIAANATAIKPDNYQTADGMTYATFYFDLTPEHLINNHKGVVRIGETVDEEGNPKNPVTYTIEFVESSLVLDDLTAANFEFTAPTTLKANADGSAVTIPTDMVAAKSEVADKIGAITVKILKADGTVVAANAVTEAGTYTVKIDVASTGYYKAAADLTGDPAWTFTVAQADPTPPPAAPVPDFSAVPEGTTVLNKNVNDIQTGLQINKVTGSTAKTHMVVSGTVNEVVVPWTDFNGALVAEQTGYYMAICVPKTLGGQEIAEMKLNSFAGEKTIGPEAFTDSTTGNGAQDCCYVVIRLKEPTAPAADKVCTVKLKYGTGELTTYTIDYSKLTYRPFTPAVIGHGYVGTVPKTEDGALNGDALTAMLIDGASHSGDWVDQTLYVTFNGALGTGKYLWFDVKVIRDSSTENWGIASVGNTTYKTYACSFQNVEQWEKHPASPAALTGGETIELNVYVTATQLPNNANPSADELGRAIYTTSFAVPANGGNVASQRPAAPTGLRATAGDQKATLNWTAPADNGGSDITGYNVYQATEGTGFTKVATVTGTTAEITGLTNGVKYGFYVTAVNAIGESAEHSNTAEATPAASGNGGGGGGGGGGVGGYLPVNPPAPVTPPTDPSTDVTPTVSNGSATAAVPADALNAAEDSENVTVNVNTNADVDSVTAQIPASAVAALAEGTDASLTVSTPVADVVIPNETLAALGGQSGTVTVSVSEADNGEVTIDIQKNGTSVGELPAPIKVSAPVSEEAAQAGTGLVAIVVDADGNETVLPKSVLDDGEMSALLETGSATVKFVDNAKDFDDVKTDWYADAVAFVSSRNLFKGTTETTFEPNTYTSRAMMVTVLHRLEMEPDASGVSFADVPSSAYYAEAASWATDLGITTGTGAGFEGEKNITREEMVTMLYRYAQELAPNAGKMGSFAGMVGADEVSDWATEAMNWAVGSGIIQGDANGLRPNGTSTRAEMATVLMNFVKLILE